MDQPSGSAVTQADAVDPGGQAAGPADRIPVAVWVIAALFAVSEMVFSDRYGFQQDELYFLVAGHHLAFGYVDQPPLTPLVTRFASLFGVSPVAVRVAPALAGAAIIVISARTAALFGARRFGRVLAALLMACAPVILGGSHLDTTTPLELLAWAVVLLCVGTAVLRERPRWWIGAGVAAGAGLQDNNLMLLLLIGLGLGLALGGRIPALRTRWPWLAAAVAALIWTPNILWQATHGWPQFAMASSLHQQNISPANYIAGLPGQLLFAGPFAAPVLIAGVIQLWRRRELRFLGIAVTVIAVYVLAWIPGKVYYDDGVLPVVMAAGAVPAERWIARARWPRWRAVLVAAAPLATVALTLPGLLPVLPIADLHVLYNHKTAATMVDTVGWPQLTRAVAGQDAALIRAGERPTAIFTGAYGEAGALDVLGGKYHLPPVLSGHNAYWMWGPGNASDRTVLVVDAVSQLRPYFASCRLLTTFHAPYQVNNDWTNLQISVCTGPRAGWPTLWPHLRHYD